jgi:hypothetical protein
MNEDWGYALLMTQLACEEVNSAIHVFADIADALACTVNDYSTEMIDDDAKMNQTIRPYTQGIFESPSVLATASPCAEMPRDERGRLFINPLSNHDSHVDVTNIESRAALVGLHKECSELIKSPRKDTFLESSAHRSTDR